MLKHFSTDDQHIEKFTEFCASEGQEELWDYTTRPRRTIVEVLADFWSSLKIPLEYVLDVFPAMKPRRFSIASSLKVHNWGGPVKSRCILMRYIYVLPLSNTRRI